MMKNWYHRVEDIGRQVSMDPHLSASSVNTDTDVLFCVLCIQTSLYSIAKSLGR